jgi:hypothetical protein
MPRSCSRRRLGSLEAQERHSPVRVWGSHVGALNVKNGGRYGFKFVLSEFQSPLGTISAQSHHYPGL